MPVRTAYAGAAVAGEVLAAANVNKIPGGWIGYNEVTASQSGITTATDLTGLSVAVTVGTSRRIRITLKSQLSSTVAGDLGELRIQEGATVLNSGGSRVDSTYGVDVHASVVLTPTAGAHTYKATLQRPVGSGSLTSTATATIPAYILVEDLGPAT